MGNAFITSSTHLVTIRADLLLYYTTTNNLSSSSTLTLLPFSDPSTSTIFSFDAISLYGPHLVARPADGKLYYTNLSLSNPTLTALTGPAEPTITFNSIYLYDTKLVVWGSDGKLYYKDLSQSTDLIALTFSETTTTTFSNNIALYGTKLVAGGIDGKLYYKDLSQPTALIPLTVTDPTIFFGINDKIFLYETRLVAIGREYGSNPKIYYTDLSTSTTLTPLTFEDPTIKVSNITSLYGTKLVALGNNSKLYYKDLSQSTDLTPLTFPEPIIVGTTTYLYGTQFVARGSDNKLYYKDLSLPTTLIPLTGPTTTFSIGYNVSLYDKKLVAIGDDGKLYYTDLAQSTDLIALTGTISLYNQTSLYGTKLVALGSDLNLYYVDLSSSFTLTAIEYTVFYNYTTSGKILFGIRNDRNLYYKDLSTSSNTLSYFNGLSSSLFSTSVFFYETQFVVIGIDGNLYYADISLSLPLTLLTATTTFSINDDSIISLYEKNLVAIGNDGKIYYTDLSSSRTLTPLTGTLSSFYSESVYHYGTKLVAVGSNGKLYYTDLSSGTPLIELTGTTALFNNDNIKNSLYGTKFVAIEIDNFENNGNIYYIDLSQSSTVLTKLTFPGLSVSFNRIVLNGTKLVALGDNEKLYYTDLSSGTPLIELIGTTINKSSDISLNGTKLVVIGMDQNLYYADLSLPNPTLILLIGTTTSFLLTKLYGTKLFGIGIDGKIYYTDLSLPNPALVKLDPPPGLKFNLFNIFIMINDRSLSSEYIVLPTINSTTVLIDTGNGFNTITFNETPIANICFPKGTPILTDQGLIAIDKINMDVHTINQKRIVDITKTVSEETFLVCFEKDVLGIDMPSQQTIISPGHTLLYEGLMHAAKWFLEKFAGVKSIPYTGEILYNVLLEKHDTMNVNNLICETLLPTNPIAKFYTKQCKLSQENRDIMIKVLQGCLDRHDFDSYNEILQCC